MDKQEAYELNWKGKESAIKNFSTKTDLTLQLETNNLTDNKLIIGDNLDALKLLLEEFEGKIKVIYIDPPYNTGSNFVYNDTRGDRGDMHSDWLSFMYPRLKLAHALLKEGGVIYMSIDDNEMANLKLLSDMVFGESNFIGDLIRKTKSTTNNTNNGFNVQHENTLVYSKGVTKLKGEPKDFSSYKYDDNDGKGKWTPDACSAPGGEGNSHFPITNPYTGKVDYPPRGRCWSFTKDKMDQFIKSGKFIFKKTHKEGERGFTVKKYVSEVRSTHGTVNSLFPTDNQFMNQNATKYLWELFPTHKVFHYTKPVEFVRKLIDFTTEEGDIVLDFFAGSGTTGEATMRANTGEVKGRTFILVQLDEAIGSNSASKESREYCEIHNLPPVISSVTNQRLLTAGSIISKSHPDVDTTFNVYSMVEGDSDDL